MDATYISGFPRFLLQFPFSRGLIITFSGARIACYKMQAGTRNTGPNRGERSLSRFGGTDSAARRCSPKIVLHSEVQFYRGAKMKLFIACGDLRTWRGIS